MSRNRLLFACVLAGLPGCGDSSPAPAPDSAPGAFTLESDDLASGAFTNAQVANVFGCTGENKSPSLKWSNPPAGTKSFLITVHDSDAPTGSGFWHWTVFDIPGTTTSLASNAAAPTGGSLPAGAIQGYTDFGAPGYGGPCPPDGDAVHHYDFKIYALSVATLGLPASAPAAAVTFTALGSSLGIAKLTATFGRGTPGTTTHPPIPTATGFTLASTDITDGTIKNDQVANMFGCGGGNKSPELHWTGVPAGTQSLVLTVYDPDAPTGSGFWHWLAYDIPATTKSLATDAGAAKVALGGTGVQAYNDAGINGYVGPCPPMGDPPHHYIFTLYAVPVPTLSVAPYGLVPGAPGGLVGFATLAAATHKATFTATYGR